MAHWAQGTYTVVNRAKYVGNGEPRYRSGWEFSFMKFCDQMMLCYSGLVNQLLSRIVIR